MGPDHHHHPGGPHGDGFGLWWLAPILAAVLLLPLLLWAVRELGIGPLAVAAEERSARAWAAATEAAERLRAARFPPGEQALLEQAAALLTLARRSPHAGERLAAYGRAGQRLADLERCCGWVLPQRAAAVFRHEARAALAGSPA
jgi:hypothetical protein